MQQTVDIPKMFYALGDQTRYRLYQLLRTNQSLCVSQLAERLNLTPACVSQHMKVLSQAQLVERVREGQRVCYQIAHHHQAHSLLESLMNSNQQKERV